jgi:hypothetical protein
MKICAIIVLCLMSLSVHAATIAKNSIEAGGERFFYADCVLTTTGGGKTLHYIIVHRDEEQFADVALEQKEARPWPPRLVSSSAIIPLTTEGVYLVRRISGVLRVDLIAGDPPSTEEKSAVEAYIRASVISPSFPLLEEPIQSITANSGELTLPVVADC